MSNRDLRTEPRLMNVIQNELQPACRALDFDADAFAKAETVSIDRAAVSRTFDYMGKHDIRPEWYDLLPDNLFVGTGLPVLVRVEGEYLGRLTGNRITAKPFTADMEAYWLCKENLKKTDGTRGNGTTLRFGRCPGLREASRYNERLFRDGEYNHPTPVGYGAESGVPFRTLVIRGLPEDTQATMDAGKTRTMANVLELQGRRNPALLATTATAVCVCEQVGLESACLNAEKPTRNEVVSFIDTHPEMNELAKRSASFYTKSGHLLSRLLYSLLWWTFNEIDSDDCRKFFDMLITGANLEAGSPVLALRNTLFEINRRGVHSDYMSRRHIAGLTVKAWNRWRDGENVKQLRFASSEPFPTAH